jgi:hypothetical protein
MSGSPDVARKLGIRPGQRICLLDASPNSAALLRATCADAEFDDALTQGHYDLIFLWPHTLDGFSEWLAKLQRRIQPDGALWVVIPKKAIAKQRGLDFTWEQMQAAALTTDLVDNKIAALTDEEYATRFVIRKERHGAYPDAMFGNG